MRLRIVLYHSEEGYAVGVPSLPGCWSQGDSKEEAMANIVDAIQDYLEAEIPMQGVEGEERPEFEQIEIEIRSWRNCPGSTT